MPPKKKTNKKKAKGGGSGAPASTMPFQLQEIDSSTFDYGAILPDNLEGENKQLVLNFLTSKTQSKEEKDLSLKIFASAVLQERAARDARSSYSEDLASTDCDDAEVQLDAAGEVACAVAESLANVAVGLGGAAGDAAGPGQSRKKIKYRPADASALGFTAGESSNRDPERLAAAPTARDRKRQARRAREARAEEDEESSSDVEGMAVAGGGGGSAGGEAAAAPQQQQRRVLPLRPNQRPPPPVVDQAVGEQLRHKVNIGWMATAISGDESCDERIARYCSMLGKECYNFINYPVGGWERSVWRTTFPMPAPPIYLPDLQLKGLSFWETYISGSISPWIDCDSEDEEHAALSAKEIVKELDYAAYLGLQTVSIELRRADNPKLAAIIARHLWATKNRTRLTIILPTTTSLRPRDPVQMPSTTPTSPAKDKLMFDEGELGFEKAKGDERDVWEMWADFRKATGNHMSLTVGLRITEDLDEEFLLPDDLARWRAEPLVMFIMHTNTFISHPSTNGADLPPAHAALLESLWYTETMYAVVRGAAIGDGIHPRVQYAQCIRSIIGPRWYRDQLDRVPNYLDRANVNYSDVLQTPLQPLSDNLQSSIYNTFEADGIKYTKYGEAIEQAIVDMATKRKRTDIVLYVLGAGRGPLMSAAIAAEGRLNAAPERSHSWKYQLRLVAVEKNINAMVTLQFLNKKAWNGRVQLVDCDMRRLAKVASEMSLPKPDIIVSELLGSWGDNELSPECLDGATGWLKEDTISIPESYTSYAAPIASSYMYHSIRQQTMQQCFKGYPMQGRSEPHVLPDGSWLQDYPQGRDVALTDQLYVAYVTQFCPLGTPHEIFTFTHPNREGKPNERKVDAEWKMEATHDVMGFICYFSTVLYKKVTLSTVPKTHTPDMLSWFPGVLPLRNYLRVHMDSTLRLHVVRKVDDGGVWYEWNASLDDNGTTTKTVMQNVNAESYYMRLLLLDD